MRTPSGRDRENGCPPRTTSATGKRVAAGALRGQRPPKELGPVGGKRDELRAPARSAIGKEMEPASYLPPRAATEASTTRRG